MSDTRFKVTVAYGDINNDYYYLYVTDFHNLMITANKILDHYDFNGDEYVLNPEYSGDADNMLKLMSVWDTAKLLLAYSYYDDFIVNDESFDDDARAAIYLLGVVKDVLMRRGVYVWYACWVNDD